MSDKRQLVPHFIGTYDDLLTFLRGQEDRLFYINLNPENPPDGARQIFLTAVKVEDAARVLPLIHTGPPPRITPSAKARIPNVDLSVRLACGMHIDPLNPQGNPPPSQLRGVGWVRFPFYSPAHYWNLETAFRFYDPIINAYHAQGTKVCLVLNHQTYGEGEGYSFTADMGDGRWAEFVSRFLPVAEKIIQRYGAKVGAYEIWNEGDVQNNPASIYIPPKPYANLLNGCGLHVKNYASTSAVIVGGLVNAVDRSITYLKQVQTALGGNLPVQGIGVHPYGWGAPDDNTVFSAIGNIQIVIDRYRAAFPNIPLWFTEVGAVGDNRPERWEAAALHMKNLYTYLKSQANTVPVVIWYGWSDGMHADQRVNGIVTPEQQPKSPIYETFFKVACG